MYLSIYSPLLYFAHVWRNRDPPPTVRDCWRSLRLGEYHTYITLGKGVRGSQGKRDRDCLRSRGCWECGGGLLKNPAAACDIPSCSTAIHYTRRKSLKKLQSALKTIPYGKKHECSPPNYCDSLVRVLSGSSCGHPRFILWQRLSKSRGQIVHN